MDSLPVYKGQAYLLPTQLILIVTWCPFCLKNQLHILDNLESGMKHAKICIRPESSCSACRVGYMFFYDVPPIHLAHLQ
jgi:hypothetical protein